MKHSLTAAMVLFSALTLVAVPTEGSTRSSAVYGYCMGCTEWKKYVKNDIFLPATVKTTISSAATFRSDFIPWPTTATLRLVSATPAVVPISKEKNLEKTHFLDFNTPIKPLVTAKRLVSSNPTPQKDHLLESDLSHQHYEERSFLLLFLVVVAAIGCAIGYRENEDKLSSSGNEDDFDMLELAPTIYDDEEQEDIPEVGTIIESKTILVGSISSGGKSVVNKAEKQVRFQDIMPQEKDFKSQRQHEGCTIPSCKSSMPLRYTCCNNSFQDKVSVEIIKFLLEDRVEKYNKSIAMPYFPFAATEKKQEEQSQDDVAADVPSTTTKESDEDESSAVSTMMNEYEDFLFQVRHSLH